MVEQMQQEMDAQTAADERKLRERILATETILAGLLAEYIQKYGYTPWAMNLDVRDGAQFVAAEDSHDPPLAATTYDQRNPNAILDRESQIEAYEAAGGFADTDPDGMS